MISEASDNVTLTVATTPPAATTVSVAVPLTPPLDAVIVATPAATAVTIPLALTDATVDELELHEKAVAATTPVDVRAVAVSCVVCAGDSVVVGVVTSMRAMVMTGLVGPSLPSPQLLIVRNALADTVANNTLDAMARSRMFVRAVVVAVRKRFVVMSISTLVPGDVGRVMGEAQYVCAPR